MNILGLSFYYHDSSAALVQDGVLVAAAEEERFSRKKHDSGFPGLAIDFVLKTGGGQGGVVDLVAVGPYHIGGPRVALIQCKSNGYVPPGDRLRLAQIAAEHSVEVYVATWRKEGRAARTVAFKPLEA